jgi:hypothetical protein
MRHAGAVTAAMPTPRPVVGSLDELLAGATHREPFGHTDSKSGSPFERVVIGGEAHILKHVHVDNDWTMRLLGDLGCVPVRVWQTGMMDLLPERIDHGTVAVAAGLGRNGWGGALLMRDLSAAMVPEGDEPLAPERNRAYLETMAALAARTWDWPDASALTPLANRWTWFGQANLARERAAGYPDAVPRIAAEGWERFAERAPAGLVPTVERLRTDASPLVAAVRTTPWAFVHGDWKLGNVGTADDGRTVLIDWTYAGIAPVAHDLGWYLALNRSRLPGPKEESIAVVRAALEGHGIATADWWDRQLALCLLGSLVQFGWEKALGDGDELGWWCDRAAEGVRHLAK